MLVMLGSDTGRGAAELAGSILRAHCPRELCADARREHHVSAATVYLRCARISLRRNDFFVLRADFLPCLLSPLLTRHCHRSPWLFLLNLLDPGSLKLFLLCPGSLEPG